MATTSVIAAAASPVEPPGVGGEGECQHCRCDDYIPHSFHKLLHSTLLKLQYSPDGQLQGAGLRRVRALELTSDFRAKLEQVTRLLEKVRARIGAS
jgi:hypothetical protein